MALAIMALASDSVHLACSAARSPPPPPPPPPPLTPAGVWGPAQECGAALPGASCASARGNCGQVSRRGQYGLHSAPGMRPLDPSPCSLLPASDAESLQVAPVWFEMRCPRTDMRGCQNGSPCLEGSDFPSDTPVSLPVQILGQNPDVEPQQSAVGSSYSALELAPAAPEGRASQLAPVRCWRDDLAPATPAVIGWRAPRRPAAPATSLLFKVRPAVADASRVRVKGRPLARPPTPRWRSCLLAAVLCGAARLFLSAGGPQVCGAGVAQTGWRRRSPTTDAGRAAPRIPTQAGPAGSVTPRLSPRCTTNTTSLPPPATARKTTRCARGRYTSQLN
ncbi:uncharacterized protein LOC126355286 [Schistocerca gregaria]|uniref:uncharacterized protein LOC126355286 n=1 Tax=Schistocerca gregaria TaxID=7010 RepID=UPI00211DB9B6|nr:uncharacterized protein LOC126355286 [Schistocerca gregaria]